MRTCADQPTSSKPAVTLVAVHGVGDATPGAISRDLAKVLTDAPAASPNSEAAPIAFQRADWVVAGQVYPRLQREADCSSHCPVAEIIEVNWADVLRPRKTPWDLIRHLFLLTLGMLRVSWEPAPGSGQSRHVARFHIWLLAGALFWIWLLAMMVLLLAACGQNHGATRWLLAGAFVAGAVFLAWFLGRHEVAFRAGYAWAGLFALAACTFWLPWHWVSFARLVEWTAAAYGWAQIVVAASLTAAFIEALWLGRGQTWTQRFARGGFIWVPFLVFCAGAVAAWAAALSLAKLGLNGDAYLEWERLFLPRLPYNPRLAEMWMMIATLLVSLVPVGVGLLLYELPDSVRQPLGLRSRGETTQDVLAVLLWVAPVVLMGASAALWTTISFRPRASATPGEVLDIYVMSAMRLGAFVPLLVPGVRVLLDVVGDVLFHLQPEGTRLDSKQWTLPRFEALLHHLRQLAPERRIVVLAHSQGTVVCWTVLKSAQALADAFVSMGSPLQSLYARFLGGSYTRLSLGPSPPWLNLYREGDYVGGRIAPARRNTPIGRGGHTNYWADDRILAPVLALLAEGERLEVRF